MRSFLILTENGPLLVMTSNSCITEGALLESMSLRGIDKFIAYEVPAEQLHNYYGVPFEVVAADLERGKQVRILDFDGTQIFDRVSFEELGQAVHFEH